MTLLYKEMRLVAHPTSIVFAFLGLSCSGSVLSLQCDFYVWLFSALYYFFKCAGNK